MLLMSQARQPSIRRAPIQTPRTNCKGLITYNIDKHEVLLQSNKVTNQLPPSPDAQEKKDATNRQIPFVPHNKDATKEQRQEGDIKYSKSRDVSTSKTTFSFTILNKKQDYGYGLHNSTIMLMVFTTARLHTSTFTRREGKEGIPQWRPYITRARRRILIYDLQPVGKGTRDEWANQASFKFTISYRSKGGTTEN
jgi:hypothetical protein